MPTPEGLQPATGTPIHSLHLSADSQYEYRRQQRQHPKEVQCAGDNGDAQGVLATTASILAAYYAAMGTFRFGLDPDSLGIPVVTSTLDLFGVLSLLAAIFILGIG